jgi:hypothetical protein
VDELTTTQGIVALAGAGVATIALILALVLAFRVRKLRSAQRTVLGDQGKQDLVGHVSTLHSEFAVLSGAMEDVSTRLQGRMNEVEDRLDGAVAYSGLVRYDAYNEMSGRQSMSIALLDARRSGVVLSSIHHRDQARLYAKRVREGHGDLDLSPEEAEAVRLALANEPVAAPEGARAAG